MSNTTGDLISRDKMIESINNHMKEIKDKDIKEVYEAFIVFINQQPIAYDVKKVVAELEEEKKQSYYKATSKNGINIDMGENIAYGKAIDIVKRGGAE